MWFSPVSEVNLRFTDRNPRSFKSETPRTAIQEMSKTGPRAGREGASRAPQPPSKKSITIPGGCPRLAEDFPARSPHWRVRRRDWPRRPRRRRRRRRLPPERLAATVGGRPSVRPSATGGCFVLLGLVFVAQLFRRDWEAGEGGSLIGRGVLDEMENEAQHIPLFTKLFTLTEIVGILSVVLIGVWTGYYRKGFAWHSDPGLQFNWHPFLMVLGMVFLYANGALIYRGFRFEKKKKLKIIHLMVLLGSFIFAIIGLVAVFDFHNNVKIPIPNMYSLHSWIGLSTVILFACQWVVGLVTFLFPGLRPSVRAAYLPVHRFFGLFIFVGAVVSCLLGLTEKIIFVNIGYSSLPPEGILVNVIGLVLVIFGGLVVYLTSNQDFRRRTTEDEVLLTDTVLE